MTDAEQRALAAALVSLFGERLNIRVLKGGFRFDWQGEEYGSLMFSQGNCGQTMALDNIVSAALNTAHDTVLEGMGYAGSGPGPLATSTADYLVRPGAFLLRVIAADGTVLSGATFKVP